MSAPNDPRDPAEPNHPKTPLDGQNPVPESPVQNTYATAEPTRSGRGFITIAGGIVAVVVLIFAFMLLADDDDLVEDAPSSASVEAD